jgi:hypothetical protein
MQIGIESNIEQKEKFMLISFLLLKIYLLYAKFGQVIGFDANPYIRVFKQTFWFKEFPPIRGYVYAYHPPLAPLMQRLISNVGLDHIDSAQILSFLCVIGSFFAFRAILKRIGILYKFYGVAFLYLAFSLPVFIFMTYEIGNDAPVFLFTIITLYLSVFLFWDKKKKSEERIRKLVMIFLVLVIAASMLVKYTGFLNIFIPLFVVLVRIESKHIFRKLIIIFLVMVVSISLVAPFYYYRNYKSQGKFFPINADWIMEGRGIAEEIAKRRQERPFSIVRNMMRVPNQSFYLNEPVRDSFFHSIWFQTWKMDKRVEEQGKISSIFSNIYLTIFFGLVLLGTVSFGLFFGGRDPTWNSLGGLLICISLLFAFGMMFYGFKYPLWNWIIFKSKYMAPSIIWIAYATVTFLMDIDHIFPKLKKYIKTPTIIFVLLFMIVNHVLPVY